MSEKQNIHNVCLEKALAALSSSLNECMHNCDHISSKWKKKPATYFREMLEAIYRKWDLQVYSCILQCTVCIYVLKRQFVDMKGKLMITTTAAEKL